MITDAALSRSQQHRGPLLVRLKQAAVRDLSDGEISRAMQDTAAPDCCAAMARTLRDAGRLTIADVDGA